jgi:copper chaperone CopZ
LQKVGFIVTGLNGPENAQDLGNAVVGISGVADVHSDTAARKLLVEYDPGLTSLAMLKGSIEGAGYPIERYVEENQ